MAQYCRQCGNPLGGSEKFCRRCGAPVSKEPEPKHYYCPSCQKEVSETASFCPHCGKPIIHEEQEKPVPVKAEEEKKPSKKIPLWLWPAAAVLLICGILLGRGSGTSQPAAEVPASKPYELKFRNMDSAGDLSMQAEHSVMNCSEFVMTPDGAEISTEPAELDLSLPGTYTISFTCEWPDHPEQTVTVEKTVHVIDEEPPVISVKEKEITIDAGSSYDVKSNIAEAYDSLDGDLPFGNEASPGSYTISGSTDFSKAGVYEFTVTAMDSSGNTSDESFTVITVSQERFVAIPEGCSSQRKDYDKLFAEMDIYGKEYTSPAYSTKDEMAHALREFEKEKYPNLPCQVYPAVHIQNGNESQWIFYDYNPWD